jgi:hypothetical protein
MQFAILLLQNSEVSAQQVEALSVETRRLLRGQFACRTCAGPAHFRRASSNGHTACFAANHLDECPEAVSSDAPWPPPGDEEVARWEANGNVISLAVDGDDDETEPNALEQRVRSPGPGLAHHRQTGPAFGSTIQRGTTNLLRQLVYWPTFKTSSVEIRLPDGSHVPVHSFFTRIRDADVERHVASLHGFWGLVHTVEDWIGRGVFLNSPPAYNRERLRLFVPSSMFPQMIRKFGLATIHDLVGRYVLIIDAARVSGSGLFMAVFYHPSRFSTIERPRNDTNE